jgi:hypothetical protein
MLNFLKQGGGTSQIAQAQSRTGVVQQMGLPESGMGQDPQFHNLFCALPRRIVNENGKQV